MEFGLIDTGVLPRTTHASYANVQPNTVGDEVDGRKYKKTVFEEFKLRYLNGRSMSEKDTECEFVQSESGRLTRFLVE